MNHAKAQLSADLRGAVRLSAQATAGLVDLVEAVHARITRAPGVGQSAPERTRGITGLVYQTVRGVTRLVGGSLDALLGLLTSALAVDAATGSAPGSAGEMDGAPRAEREALVAALNGVLGDHLAATGNPLAITMRLRHQGRPLVLERSALQQAFPKGQGRLLVLLHGLCMNDLQWQREGHDHGAALARELGYTPIYLHYNSGLPLATNGALFAQQMAALVAAWPHPIERLVLMGHSMGGLVARSALWATTPPAGLPAPNWAAAVTDLVFLGTPHHGAPLERAGHWVDEVLARTPFLSPLARVGLVRSAGIQNLRYGLQGPLPTGIRCYAVAGQLGAEPQHLKARLLGDGLVAQASALGQHRQPARRLAFPAEHQWVGQNINHLQLLNHADVYARLRHWLRA
jgi:pimeloyl-ACP methyl ester carboxylesterase